MRLELPEKKKLVYEMTIPIRWGDMDAMGHVNNTNYFRYMEVVRIEWARSLGEALDGNTVEGMVIINAFCTFHRQFEYPATVLARMYVSDPGRTSFESWTTMTKVDEPDAVYASGGATIVWADYSKQKSVPLPEHVRRLVES
ncbi:MAG TPA: thioesterase family protein [Ramlibacter sp.]|jgi:acyl-CoA thioester hydrolase